MLSRRATGFILSEVAGILLLAFLFYFLQASGATAMSDIWASNRVITYVLLFVGPLLIFLPATSWLALGPVWLLGAGSWALLGYVLIFVGPPPREEASFFTYIAFLALFFVALASLLALVAGAVGKSLLPPAATPFVNLVRALRQGALVSLFVIALMAMSPLGVLSWLNTLLVFAILALTEFFFLARN